MDKLGQKICKGRKVMAVDSIGMVGGLAILWHLESICLTNWRKNHFLMMESFAFLETGVKGTLMNVYGLSIWNNISMLRK